MPDQKEINELKERIKQGNLKLNRAWEQLKEIADSDHARWVEEMEKWHQANERLSALCLQLQVWGFTDCLYIWYYDDLNEDLRKKAKDRVKRKELIEVKDGKACKRPCLVGIGCRVCPSEIEYWGQELMDLPSGRQQHEMKLDREQ